MKATPPSATLNTLPSIFVLYKYFLAADAMRRYFQKHLGEKQYSRALRAHGEMGYAVMFHLGPPGIGMAYFYSAMYVLVEGWKELGFQDSKIDSLLKSPLLSHLRRFRNATFHFQQDFVSEKWSNFIDGGKASSKWIIELRDAFSTFFWNEENWVGITPAIPEELKAKIKGRPVDEILGIVSEYFDTGSKERCAPSARGHTTPE
jgi:hypothetical protein